MKQIISLSIVLNAFDTAEMQRMNRALGFVWVKGRYLQCRVFRPVMPVTPPRTVPVSPPLP